MRRYELMLLLRPDLEDDKLQAAVEKVTRAIVNGGGSLSKVSPWGKRRLAYDINRHREASYFLIHFDIEPSQVREIERGMLISEEILRHLVTVLEDRGPADELAPAAAARSLDGEFDLDDGDQPASEVGVTPVFSSEPVDAPRRADPDDDDADAVDAPDESRDEDTTNETSVDSSDDGAQEEVDPLSADVEPVAADARAEKEPT
jgi:small subunit ribosomal protein S6